MSKQGLNNDGMFECNGNKFIFRVNIYSNNLARTSMTMQLDTGNIISFQHSIGMNDLCMTGSITYVDIQGGVDKFLHKEYTYARVEMFAVDPKTDYKPLREQLMYHIFHVNSIEILDRQKNEITYKLNLVSANWWKCTANLDFSNYGQKPEAIKSILKKLLVQCDLTIDQKMFDKVQTDVKLNWIASGNENMFTATKYLLSRQYYYSKQKEQALKFLCYDNVFDKYYLYDLSNEQTLKSAEQVLVSMFESSNEQMIGSYMSNFSTNTYFPFAKVFRSLRENRVTDYNYQKNVFLDKPIKEEDLLQYQNKHFNIDSTFDKFEKRFTCTRDFVQRSTYWCNQSIEQIYQNAIDTLVGYNGFIINVLGNMKRKPGSCVMLNVDRCSTTRNEDIDKMSKRYKSIEGHWIIMNIDTVIRPNADSTQRFTQNLTMTRNFVFDDVDKDKKL